MIRYVISILIGILTYSAGPASASGGTGADNDSIVGFETGGHSKYRIDYLTYPSNSIWHEVAGSSTLAQFLEARLKVAARQGHWDVQADYQLIAIHAETLWLATSLPESVLPLSTIISDDRRWWNLTYSFGDDRTAIIHRLDRLSVGFTTEHSVWRFGRQAISWGNGLIFTPMDVFNPFDPAAVDKEYKPGDDMLYGQYLLQNGDDLQGVAVVRRNPDNGDVEMDQSSLALKYHTFVGAVELDLLAARHYGDRLFGLGGNLGLGGAVWRGDLTWTRTGDDDILAAVTSLNYSWTWNDHNINGVIEYYYNGFGQPDGRYSPDQLAQNPALLARLERGELYTLARNYLGASAMLEVSPLLLLTSNAFINLDDPSALLQLVVQYSIAQDLAVTGAVNVPVGPPASEYGGIPTSFPDRYWSTGPGLFAQLAWYF